MHVCNLGELMRIAVTDRPENRFNSSVESTLNPRCHISESHIRPCVKPNMHLYILCNL